MARRRQGRVEDPGELLPVLHTPGTWDEVAQHRLPFHFDADTLAAYESAAKELFGDSATNGGKLRFTMKERSAIEKE